MKSEIQLMLMNWKKDWESIEEYNVNVARWLNKDGLTIEKREKALQMNAQEEQKRLQKEAEEYAQEKVEELTKKQREELDEEYKTKENLSMVYATGITLAFYFFSGGFHDIVGFPANILSLLKTEFRFFYSVFQTLPPNLNILFSDAIVMALLILSTIFLVRIIKHYIYNLLDIESLIITIAIVAILAFANQLLPVNSVWIFIVTEAAYTIARSIYIYVKED